jgi:DNA polymerase I
MWIFDTYYKGAVHLWARDRGLVRAAAVQPPSFYLYLPDPASHRGMIEALESLYRLEEATFSTIYGRREGYRIYADRSVAEKIEVQTRYAAELYNVDIRRDQQYLAERDIFPCGEKDESRFSPDFASPLREMRLHFSGDPQRRREISGVDLTWGEADAGKLGADGGGIGGLRRLEGEERCIMSDLMELLRLHDPDVLLVDRGDLWVPLLAEKAARLGVEEHISRSGGFRRMAARSYWSYGRANHKDMALIPEGRILIDTASSFAYREGGLQGILLASRLSGLPPNLAARFTPGTLISSYEVYEALRRGLAVPFRKRDAESVREISDLRRSDRGGMILQPEPGLYEMVSQIDFTSLYPSIIVKHNLSPETLRHPEKRGFLSGIISPLLELRIEMKRRKKLDATYSGQDAILKWMLVTCFGYTGYRNAKFGQIEVHERITAISRELLMQIKELAEGMDLEVLHGIVDCLWVRGAGDVRETEKFKQAVEEQTGILTEKEDYQWIVFLPLADGGGAYNRYFGRLTSGRVKVRGVMARRGDTPPYVARMQKEIFQLLAAAASSEELQKAEPMARQIWERYRAGLPQAQPREMVIRRRVGRTVYSRRCAEAAAIKAHQKLGLHLEPGMEMGYVVVDAGSWEVEAEETAENFDVRHYSGLLDKAWREVSYVFGPEEAPLAGGGLQTREAT